MKKRNLLAAATTLLVSIVAIQLFSLIAKRLDNSVAPQWLEVPVYTYLSPYATLSPYDSHFREAADSTGYDWTLIAAIAFTESRFDSTAVSEAGAQGVMQVMPETLRGFGIPDSLHTDNRTNIMTAARLLQSLEKQFRPIKSTEERIKFQLASYNAGYGHIQDAMQLAKKHGMEYLYITCNHTNIPSKKTLEYLGGEFVELAELPEDNDMRVRDGQTHVLVYKFTF